MDKRRRRASETSNSSSPLPPTPMAANTLPITPNLPAIYHVPHSSETITRPAEGLLNADALEHTPLTPVAIAQQRAFEHPNESMDDFDTRSLMWSNALLASHRLDPGVLRGEFLALVSSLERGLYDPRRQGGVSLVHGTSALERRCMMYAAANDTHLLAEIQETRLEVGGLLLRLMLNVTEVCLSDRRDARRDGEDETGGQD